MYRWRGSPVSTAYARDVPATPARDSYHHGALREELITASLKLIEAEGIGAVSLRRVAREAGVSPGAPYHHFADRSALLAAITVRGSVLLEHQLRQARQQAPTPAKALGALIETYVTFAAGNPAYVHLLLRPELSQPERHPGSRARNHQPEKLCDAGGGQRPGQGPAVRPAEPRHEQQGGNQE